MLLVMSLQNVLEPQSEVNTAYCIWDITWEKVNPIFPSFQEQISIELDNATIPKALSTENSS